MVFQDPMTSLNPVQTIGRQLREAVLLHNDVSGAEASARALHHLAEVGIPNAARRMDEYPHQFSGGMRQRVMIAMALDQQPGLADRRRTDDRARRHHSGSDSRPDEASAASYGSAIIMITHDLGVVAEIADHVVVMYAARVAERAPAEVLFEPPRAPVHLGPDAIAAAARIRRASVWFRSRDSRRRCSTRRAGVAFIRGAHLLFDRCSRETPELLTSSVDANACSCLLPHNDARRRRI